WARGWGPRGAWGRRPRPPAIVALCRAALAFRPAVMVSGARPAAERAWLISASTWAAGLPGEEPAAAAGEDAGRLGDADAGGDDPRGRGRGAPAVAPRGAGARAGWTGRAAREPADGSQAEGVCRAVTLPGAGAETGAEAGPRVR